MSVTSPETLAKIDAVRPRRTKMGMVRAHIAGLNKSIANRAPVADLLVILNAELAKEGLEPMSKSTLEMYLHRAREEDAGRKTREES